MWRKRSTGRRFKENLRTYIWCKIQLLIPRQRLRHIHHLREDEKIFEVVRNLLRDKLHKVWYQLVEAWVVFQTRQTSCAIFFLRFIDDGIAHLLKVQLQLFRQYVLDLWLRSNVVGAAHGSQGRVGIRAFG